MSRPTPLNHETEPPAGPSGRRTRLMDERRDLWRAFGPAAALSLAGFVLAWFFMAPAPPDQITIAAGPRDGAYYRYCQQYAECLAENGITLHVLETAGSVENYDRLLHDPDVSVALVQGGTAPNDPPAVSLESIAGVFPEPLWIFCRGTARRTEVRQLRGQRIAIGPPGSGTRRMARLILSTAGLSAENGDFHPDSRTGAAAARALIAGELDAALFVSTADTDWMESLLRCPDVRLVTLDRQRAWTQRYPWLQPVTLARGVFDLENDLPREDIDLVAPSASLVAAPELHDAFVPLFLEAVHRVHGRAGLFEHPGDFPRGRRLEHPLNASAAEYFRHGPSPADRYLPFWIASLIARTKIFLVPLLTLLFPLVRLTPPLYRWRIRSRIYRWYEVLRRIDQDLSDPASSCSPEACRNELERMEQELREIRVPLSYMEEFYHLHLHLELVQRRLSEQQQQPPAAAQAA